ncbi:hypothetical protein HPHPP2B_0111 [Helicobacter pylori Hp P-2b]|uniref:Uncharacterized protein n=1 Tax=Helicobacter pylori Hp P-2 TaxID=992073 RepID=J0PLF1_HELPX|nr:hypothetical protein HPHPP2_0110 [Helicobacter pylori Hp P-2]EJC57334.1 hypothetical protein HPHPP2B_0111 [Helicobacter pylori Hp P-2b]
MKPPLFLKKTLEFLGEMIAKPFYLLKKIIFIIYNKSQAIKSHFLEKILFTTNLKQPNNQS